MTKSKQAKSVTWRDFVPPIMFKVSGLIDKKLDTSTVNNVHIGLSIFFLATVLLTIIITNVVPNVVADTVYSISVATYKVPKVKRVNSLNALDDIGVPQDVLGVKDEPQHNEVPDNGKIEIQEELDGRWVSFSVEEEEKTSVPQTNVSAYTYYSYGL